MPGHHPHAPDLLEAVKLHLSEELLPTLDGYHAYQLRVAVNLLSIVQREMEQGAAAADAGAARLAALGYADADDLASAIREGRADIDDPALCEHLVRGLREALAINNPKWLKEPA